MKRVKRFKKGVTLVELVVVLALISLLSLGVFQIYDVITSQNNKIENKSKLQFEAQILNEELFKRIAEAKEITNLNTNGLNEIINFEIKTLDSSKINFVSCVFEVKDKNLFMIYDGEKNKISDKIKYFKVKNINKGDNLKECESLEIEIVLNYGDETYKINEKVKFRNNKG